MRKPLRILVTNDDGIHAPGLAVAESIARALSDDVWVVAPENEQSGASHSLTLASPLRLRKIGERRFAAADGERDIVDRAHLADAAQQHAARDRETHAQVLDFEDHVLRCAHVSVGRGGSGRSGPAPSR